MPKGGNVTPEQDSLERALTDAVREVSTAARLADMAGLDAAQIDRTGSVADVWHSIIGMAIQDGVLNELVDRVRLEHPRNTVIRTAWQAYQAATLPARGPVKRPPRGQAGTNLSDNYRTDNRIDALQKEVSDLRAQFAELKSTLSFMIGQNNTLSEQNKTILRVLDEQNNAILRARDEQNNAILRARDEHPENVALPHAFQWYVAVLVVIVLVVFAIVYVGGHV